MKYLLFLFGFLTFSANAQDSIHQDFVNRFKAFIPDGYFLLNVELENLNLDSNQDAILVLGQVGEDSLSTNEHPLKRKFLLLLGQEGGSYKVEVENDNLIYYSGYDANFRDCYVGAFVRDGIISLNFYGGFRMRWSRSVTFEYNPKRRHWYLISDERSTFDVLSEDLEMTSDQTLTQKDFRKVRLEDFSIYKE